MPLLAMPAPFLWGSAVGFALGAGASSAVFAAVEYHRRHVRRLVLGFAARSLQDALAALMEDGDLTYRLMHQVEGLHDLAAAVARVAGE